MFDNFLNTVKNAAHSLEEQQRNQSASNDEQIEKVDSKGGKVQVSSIQDQKQPELNSKGSDFLSGLVNVAQVVGKSLEESNRQKQGNVEETVGKVDSKGGKVQVSSIQDEQKKPENDFLSGLVNVAQDIGKVVGKSLEEQKTNEEVAGKIDSKNGKVQVSSIQENKKKAPQFNDSDLKALGENIGSIVGGIWKKEETQKKEEPIIDDIEGEIGKVTTTGYTATTIKKNQ